MRVDAPLAAALLLLSTAPVAAQDAGTRPLSAINWLDQRMDDPILAPIRPRIDEPPVAGHVSIPQVEMSALDSATSGAVGLLPTAVTGLPASLWSASETQDLTELWHSARQQPLPVIAGLYHTLLLAEAERPQGASDAYLRTRVEMLRRFGAVDPALALLARAGPQTPALFSDWFNLALLEGGETEACTTLRETPSLMRDDAARIYCTALTGDWRTAALLYDTATALGVIEKTESALLELFLDPELAESAPVPQPSAAPSPLEFRLFEAIGAPLSTRGLPLAYAMADLRGTVGWKAEIEAAERLTSAGALAPQRLMGLYTRQSPAASGGVWNRVKAVQALDAALDADDIPRRGSALTDAWAQMGSVGLEVPFAHLFGPRLSGIDLPDSVQALTYRIRLLTDDYEAAASTSPKARADTFLAGIARGRPDIAQASGSTERMIAEAFGGPPVAASDHAKLIKMGKLGEAILHAALQFDGADGDPGEMASALGTLRFVGMEDTARRAALQVLILEQDL